MTPERIGLGGIREESGLGQWPEECPPPFFPCVEIAEWDRIAGSVAWIPDRLSLPGASTRRPGHDFQALYQRRSQFLGRYPIFSTGLRASALSQTSYMVTPCAPLKTVAVNPC